MIGSNVAPQGGPDSGGLREFIGFVWTDDWLDRTGMLVEAHDAAEAVEIVRSFDPEWHVSLWNDEDASSAR